MFMLTSWESEDDFVAIEIDMTASEAVARILVIGVGGAGFFLMKKKNGGKAAVQIEPDDTADDEEDDVPINEDDEYRFYDGNDENDDE